MKISITLLTFLILAAACSSRTAETTSTDSEQITQDIKPGLTPEDLQGEWHMITEQNGEWVLFYPCDADNTFVQVKGDSIVIGWGQDATGGIIEDWLEGDTGNQITLAVNDSYSVNYYRVEKAENGNTVWWLWEDADNPSQFINAVNKPNYKEVRQPCKECWEDCDEE